MLLFAGPMLVLLLALIGGQAKQITERRFLELSWMSAFFLDISRASPRSSSSGAARNRPRQSERSAATTATRPWTVLATAFQSSLVMEWAATAATAMVALEVSLRLMQGALSFHVALAVLLLTPEFFLPLRQLALKYHAGATGKAAAQRMFAILDTQVPAGSWGRGHGAGSIRGCSVLPLRQAHFSATRSCSAESTLQAYGIDASGCPTLRSPLR